MAGIADVDLADTSAHEEAIDQFPLLSLPDEIILMVLRRLRLAEHVILYESCTRMRALLTERHVVSERCSLGRGPLATADTLRRPLMRDLASRIQHLDLSCVFDLNFRKLVPVLKRMTNLTSIDLSHTNLTLSDLREGFPTLKDICINSEMTPDDSSDREISYKNVFRNAERIHLVKNYNHSFIHTNLGHHLTNEKILKELQFTCNQVDLSIFWFIVRESVAVIKALHVNYIASYGAYACDPTLKCVECLIIDEYQRFPTVVMSETLYRKSKENDFQLSCPISSLHDYDEKLLTAKWSLYIWHPKIVEHNQDFYKKMLHELERKIPIYVCINTWSKVTPHKKHYSNSYFISPCTFETSNVLMPPSVPLPKRRSRLENYTLDIDKFVQPDKDFKLTLNEFCQCHIMNGYFNIDLGSVNVRNLTFLHIHNICSLQVTFFQNIFNTCKRLTTLNLDNDTFSSASLLLCNALHLAKALKNLRIREPANTNSHLYPAMARCPTLENVHICEVPFRMEVSTDSLINFLENCKHLYSYCVYSNFSSVKNAKKIVQLLRKAAPAKNVHIELCQMDNIGVYTSFLISSDPYYDIFFQESVYKSIQLDLQFPEDYQSF